MSSRSNEKSKINTNPNQSSNLSLYEKLQENKAAKQVEFYEESKAGIPLELLVLKN